MPELDDLETLADDVRASAPRPREAYLARLDQRVQEGFPKQKPQRDRSWLWTPGLALAACALIALVVAAGMLGTGSDDSEESAGSSGLVDASGEAAPEESGTSTFRRDVAPAAPSRASGRRVERRTTLDLAPGDDAFEETTAGVLRIADASDTIVQRSSVSERDGKGYATYDLRVPASRLDDVLAQLSALAKVTSRTASAQDITAPYTSAAARLADARAERRAILRALEREPTDALRARLREARTRISRAERDVRRLQRRSDRARLDVTVRSTGIDGDGGAWTPGDALDDAGRVLEVAAGVAVVVGAVLLPFAVLLALAAAAARLTRRRRREAALG